jgi:hypothetical protein
MAKLTIPAYSLQFLALTPYGSTEWVTHCQTSTEEWAWAHLDRLERSYPTKRWRWVLQAQDTCFSHV